MGSSEAMISEFKANMKMQFEITDLGVLSYFLGLEVNQDVKGIHIAQKKYTEDLLKEYSMQQCKAVPTPLNSSEKLQQVDGSGKAIPKRYRSLIGRLIYLTHTRLDISFAVGVLSQFMNYPSNKHYAAGKRVLSYLVGSVGCDLWYSAAGEWKLEGYSDNDWGGCVEDRKSTTRFVFKL